MNKAQYTAEVIRDMLTTAKVDLYCDSKTVIRRIIENALQKAEQDWPEYNQRQEERRYY